jgi:ABC-type transport system substrate-binding protein
MKGEEKTKYIKNIFIIVTIILVLLAIYIICVRNINKPEDNERNVKKVEIKKDIIIGVTEFDTLNPITTKSLEVQYISKLIYKPLIEITQNFNIEAGLAKECSKTGNTEYIIKLDDVKWQNGSIVTARDVEFTINMIKETDSIYKQNVEKIESIDIIDDKTIKVKLAEETSFFEYLLCFPIVKENTYNNENIGTGPYKVEEINNKEIILGNEERKITIKIYDSVAEMYSNFTKEKLDFIITQNNEYDEHIGNIGFSEQLITGRNYYYLTFNNKKLEKEIKNQIKNLLNREKIIYEIYNNKYKVADFPLEYGSYLCNYMEKTNTENAEIPIQLTLGVSNDEELYAIAEQIKKQLNEKDIEINIKYYNRFEDAIKNNYYDLLLNKKMVDIMPKIDYYFQEIETKNKILGIYDIEDKNVLKEEYNKIIEQYKEEIPFMGLFFDSYIILHNSKLKGDFSGNWYNPFYNIDTWYKVE